MRCAMVGRQPADFPQGERRVGVRRHRRVAADEDEFEPVIRRFLVVNRPSVPVMQHPGDLVLRGFKSLAAALASMALNRPVEISQARGLAGIPSAGQRSSAARKAFCRAPLRRRNRRAAASAKPRSGPTPPGRCARSGREWRRHQRTWGERRQPKLQPSPPPGRADKSHPLTG